MRSLCIAALVCLGLACSSTPSTPLDAAGDRGVPDGLSFPDHAPRETGGDLRPADGSHAEAAADAAPALDPGQTGVLKWVKTTQAGVPVADGRKTDVVLCAPSPDGVSAGPGPYPLVILSPGFMMGTDQYFSYCTHLASWGFLVVLRDYSQLAVFISHEDQAKDAAALLDWVSSGGPFAGKVDTSRFAAAGHSIGGKVSILSAIRDARFKAVVGWDPVDTNSPSVAPELMGGLKVPLAVVGETTNATGGLQPCAPAAENFTQYYAAASSPALEITLLGADHMDWVDNTGCLLCGVCTAGTASDAEVKRLTRRTTVAFFRRYLLGETAMDTYLTGAAIKADSALLSFASK